METKYLVAGGVALAAVGAWYLFGREEEAVAAVQADVDEEEPEVMVDEPVADDDVEETASAGRRLHKVKRHKPKGRHQHSGGRHAHRHGRHSERGGRHDRAPEESAPHQESAPPVVVLPGGGIRPPDVIKPPPGASAAGAGPSTSAGSMGPGRSGGFKASAASLPAERRQEPKPVPSPAPVKAGQVGLPRRKGQASPREERAVAPVIPVPAVPAVRSAPKSPAPKAIAPKLTSAKKVKSKKKKPVVGQVVPPMIGPSGRKAK